MPAPNCSHHGVCCCGIRGIADTADDLAGNHHAIGDVTDFAGLLRRAHPEAHNHGHRDVPACTVHQRAQPVVHRHLAAGHAGNRNQIDEALRLLANLLHAGVISGGCRERDQRHARCPCRRADVAGLVHGQVGNDDAGHPCVGRAAQKI